MVSAIPAEVRIETFVRAATAAALSDANRKVDRALRAGALALGAQLELTTVAGYLPMRQSPELVGADGLGRVGHRGGGTDMGDLGHIMPVLHPFAGGASGSTHGADFVSTITTRLP